MLFVIFGAGASFDSDPQRPAGGPYHEDRPPLAAQLFQGLDSVQGAAAETFQLASPLLMRLRACTGESIEAELEKLQAEVDVYPERAGHLMALRFYLQRVLTQTPEQWRAGCRGLTNYVTLLDRVLQWSHSSGTSVRFVTFNYDTLLEDALDRVMGPRIRSLDAYVIEDRWRLYKPHGSVNWARPSGWPGNEGQPFISDQDAGRNSYCRELLVHGQPQLEPIQFVHTEDFGSDRFVEKADRRAFVPALSIPVERKLHFELPDQHMQHLRADLGRATGLITIGWRGRENHFLRLLQDEMPNAQTPLLAVGGRPGDGYETYGQLNQTGRIGAWAIHDGGFSSFVTDVQNSGDADWASLQGFLDGSAAMRSANPGKGLAA